MQVRLGSPALDNTHDAHRTSALTTMALPLTDDRAAIERTLWYATNRGYGKALDALEKVKTEQQVRAREEDSVAGLLRRAPAGGDPADGAAAQRGPQRVGVAAA